MRNAVLLALFTLSAFAAHADDRRPDKSTLTIMSWNVEFMWDGLPPEEGNERIQFPHRGNPKLAAAKMERIAKIIRRYDPDIVSLDEVENLDALKLLNDRFLEGMGYEPYLKNGRDQYTGQDVGILTRIDPDEPLWREDRKGESGNVRKSASKNYIAKFTVGEESIALIGVHFLSRPTDRDRMHERQAQADSIRAAAVKLDAEGYSVVIAGDINDYDGSREASDHQSNQPITTVLADLKGMDPATDEDDLVNAAQFVPKRRRFTCHWDKNRNGRVDGRSELTSIDHVLLAPELAERVDSVEFMNNYEPSGISDHFPIMVTIGTD
ncbi:MAG: endonuclease/exonuclease/phosphatase family protein [Planctomycetota bacterium]